MSLEGDDGASVVDINSAEISQPMTTCLQIALIDLLASFGIHPSVVLGHSSAEIAAAYAAGALSHTSAIKAAYYRGVLSSLLASSWQNSPSDTLTMMDVALSRQEVTPYLQKLTNSVEDDVPGVAIGCVNSPKSVTLTGAKSQIDILEEWFHRDGIFARRLKVPLTYHSRFMEAIADEYSASIQDLETVSEDSASEKRVPKIPMIFSVTGDIVAPKTLVSPNYWVRNLVSSVEFATVMDKLLIITHLLEIGPRSALQGPIRECIELQPHPIKRNPLYIPTLVRKQSASVALLQAVGALWSAGHDGVDLMQANGLEKQLSRPIPPNMPRYPFNHEQKYWIESTLSRNFHFNGVRRHDLLGSRSFDWNPQVAQWRNVMRLDELPWLKDHTISGEIVFPGAGYVVMAIEAARQLFCSKDNGVTIHGFYIQDAAFSHPIRFPSNVEQVKTQTTLLSQPSHSFQF
ncbi:acyl transferase/acyl hydrolase/lysophospholipase [Podospora fimiseda]|uniref:Acyl transferase/acyl hydrolase/lysophospholipase n=1 Tax=Podospora fimiseda TaxID=252190 RepID=A0AAN7GTT9_9PEZI|nr:acyl transferase/acyl hydrolase/lysophospholipase [Podospora fimiseda]